MLILDDKSIRLRRLKAFAWHCRDANAILTGVRTKVEVQERGPAPAWSVDNEITFNAGTAPDMLNLADYVIVTGLNWHEMCHVLYTPTLKYITAHGPDDMVTNILSDAEYAHAFNILEDQRIETLFVAKHKMMARYFTATFIRYCLEDDRAIPTAYLLAHGRKYLDKRLRRSLAKAFKCKDRHNVLMEVSRIIDEYRMLNLAKSTDLYRAHDLILEFVAITRRGGLAGTKPQCDSAERVGKESMGGTPKRPDPSEAEQDALIERVKKALEDGEEQDVPTSQAQVSHQEMRAAKQKAMDQVEDDAQVQRDMKDAEDFVNSKLPIVMDTVPYHSWAASMVDGSWIRNAKEVADALRTTEMDQDPHWLRRQSSGRLNLGRAMHGQPYDDDLWDVWQPGGYGGLDVEGCTLLDVSISMRYQMSQLQKAAWVIKAASDDADVKMSVWTYSDISRVVYTSEDRAQAERWAHFQTEGATQPYSALMESLYTLKASRRRVKLFFIMTDGSWDHTFGPAPYTTNESIIEALNADGVITSLVYLRKSKTPVTPSGHGTQHQFVIDSMDEMPGVCRDVMSVAMKGVGLQ